MHVGIDLGTTYSCVAYLDDEGEPQVIPSTDGESITPSVIWFDGRQAYVGRKANLRKEALPMHIYEFVKRDIGKPVEVPPHLYEQGGVIPEAAPYEVGGFKYGAAGMSAVILRKLKKEAVQHFKRLGELDRDLDEKDCPLDAVITVPAYFGDKERQETRLAGYAAGLNVIGIINEPTAAALSFGLMRSRPQTIMVFDLGGGTFDVTILETENGDARVRTSGGDNALGGKDWDELIQAHLYDAFQRDNGQRIPDDRGFEVQQLALQAKLELSERDEALVQMSLPEGELYRTLHRAGPAALNPYEAVDPDTFYFEQRASALLHRCRVLCEYALEQVERPTPDAGTRPLQWDDLDEIVLAGGSCRMPMVAEMLERVSGRPVRRSIEGFDYDTAIAIGAALYGAHRSRVRDVVSHSVGVKLMREDGSEYVEHLIRKDTPLPAGPVQRTYPAGRNAWLDVYEGESSHPAECILRGHVELENEEGHVTILMEADRDGVLTATAEYPEGRKVLEMQNELYAYEERALPLREKVQSIHINL